MSWDRDSAKLSVNSSQFEVYTALPWEVCDRAPECGKATDGITGLFGSAAATALEDLPYDARGMLSGLYEMGYSVGYLLAAAFYRALVPTTTHGWRSLFWFGAAPPVLLIWFRWSLPETNHFQVMKAEREARARASSEDQGQVGLRAWLRDSGRALKVDWVLLVYLVITMSGFNAVSHGSQDVSHVTDHLVSLLTG